MLRGPAKAIQSTSYYFIDDVHEILVIKWSKQLLVNITFVKIVFHLYDARVANVVMLLWAVTKISLRYWNSLSSLQFQQIF